MASQANCVNEALFCMHPNMRMKESRNTHSTLIWFDKYVQRTTMNYVRLDGFISMHTLIAIATMKPLMDAQGFVGD